MNKPDVKKLILLNLPYVFAFYFADKIAAVFRLAPGTEFIDKLTNGFAVLLSEWLGELNVSHTGGRFYPKGQSEPTASLGLFFDWNYTGQRDAHCRSHRERSVR